MLEGELFLLVNRRRTSCKVLVWDGTGLCIFSKRLEGGRFASLWRDDGKVVRLTASEFTLFIEGSDLVGRRSLSPTGIVREKLVSDRLDLDDGLAAALGACPVERRLGSQTSDISEVGSDARAREVEALGDARGAR